MKRINYVCLKIISVLLISSFASCAAQRGMKQDVTSTSVILNDFLNEYKKMNPDKPHGLLICEYKKSVITIINIPENATLGYLISSLHEQGNLRAGMFSGVLCFYHSNVNGFDSMNFKNVPSRIKRRAEKGIKLKLNGREISMSYNMMEWEPDLEIKYNLISNEKELINYRERIKTTERFPLSVVNDPR